MAKSNTLKLVSFIFGLIAVLHLLRAIYQWQAVIGTLEIPVYVSYITVVVAGYLSWLTYNESKKK